MNINSTTDKSSFANNQERKNLPDGIISVVPPPDIQPFLPDDIWAHHIFPLLNYRDIISTTLAFQYASMTIYHDKNLISNSWLSIFTPQQKASFKKCIQKMSSAETYRWMCQFSTNESMTRFLEEHTTADYAESFIFKRALSMHSCPIFKVEEKCDIKHAEGIELVAFSADSFHLVTTSHDSTARIYGQDSSGKWVLKTIIDHHAGWIKSAIFSADDSHVITLSDTETAKIYGQDSNGEWVEKTIIQYPERWYARSATFSADSLHAMLVSVSKRDPNSIVQIYGRGSNGEWTQRAIINYNSEWITAIFSPDNRKVLITDYNGATQIYGQDSSGDTWTQKTVIESNKAALLGSFSADGRHLAITYKGRFTGIYGQDLNGQWTQKILIKNDNTVYAPIKTTFSNGGRLVLIISGGDKTVKICEKSSNVEWTEKATIQHLAQVHFTTFSSDSRHVMTYSCDGNVQIHSRMADNEWIQKVTTQHVQRFFGKGEISTSFSADNRYMLTVSTHSTITIYEWTSDEEWIQNCIIDLGVDKAINKATFSCDGSHLIVITVGIIKIYGLNSKDNIWKEKARIEHTGANNASISADGGHVVTVDNTSGIAKIWRLYQDRNVFCSAPIKQSPWS